MVCLGVLSTAIIMAEDAPAAGGTDKGACKAVEKGKWEHQKGDKVELSAVPAAVTDAAAKEVPGFVTSSAEMTKKDDATIYRLMGKANDKDYFVVVDSTGKVLKSMEKGVGHGKKKEFKAE